MPPPRTRQRPRFRLSNYDRELLQAVHDRRLDRDDPEVQAVLQRVEQAPTGEPWQTASVSMQPEAPPPPSQFESDLAMTRAGQAGREGVVSLLPRSYSLFDEPAAENRPSPRPDHYTVPDLGRDVLNVATSVATQPIGDNPYSPDVQDALREQGLPTDPRIQGPWGGLEAATGALPATAGALFDLATGETDPDIPDLANNPPTWRSIAEARDAPEWAQTVGTVADLLVGPEDLVFPGGSLALSAAMGVGRAVSRIPKALRSAEKALPAKNWNLFRQGVEATDNATRPLSMLLPAEIEPLTRSSGAVQLFVDTYNRLPDANYLASAIKRGAPKRGWYANSRQALTGIFGDDADMFTGVLAAMSPQTSVESNMTNALNTFVNWRAAGRPTSEQEIKAILARSVQGGTEKSVLQAWTPNTVRVLQGGQSISGPKIDQFWLALRDRSLETRVGSLAPDDAMVLDAWMGNLMGASQKLWSGSLSEANAATRLAAGDAGATPSYLAGVARMREAAKKAGVEGAEAQEMAWSTAMALYERASSLSISAREVLRLGLLTDDVVAGTPDFATLLRDPEFSSILNRDTGLSSRMASFNPAPRTRTGAVTMSDTDQRHLLRVADTLDNLRSMRVTDTAVQTEKTPMDELAAVMATEAVTDKQWSSLGAPYSDTTPGQRAHVSPRVFGASETLLEQSAVLDAALGGGTGSRSRGVGSWVDDVGQPQIDDLRERIDTLRHGDERQDLERLLAQLEAAQVQENPLASYGARVQEARGGGIPVGEERRLRAARDIIAGGTGQSAAAHVAINPRMPRAQHDAATIYAARNIPANAVKAFAADLRALDVPGSFTQVHSGRSVRVLRLDDRFKPLAMSPADEASVRELAGRHLGTKNAKGQQVAPSMTTGQNVAVYGFRPIAQGADPKSGKRVRRMVGDVSDWAKLSPAVQRRMDTAIKAWATRLQETYDMSLIRRERPDEARMIEILASSGGSGLAKAREAGVVLPVLAALGFGLASSRASGAVPQGEEL